MAASLKTQAKWALFAEHYVLTGCGNKAAKAAGYGGKDASLRVTGTRLLKNPQVRDLIDTIQREVKAKPLKPKPAKKANKPVVIGELLDQQLEQTEAARQRVRIDTEDKRELLWEVACHNGRVVTSEDIEEREEMDGSLTRVILRTERIFDSQGCINAVLAMSQIDGDIKAPGQGTGGGLSIENLLLSIGH
jgi:ribosomal protein S25